MDEGIEPTEAQYAAMQRIADAGGRMRLVDLGAMTIWETKIISTKWCRTEHVGVFEGYVVLTDEGRSALASRQKV